MRRSVIGGLALGLMAGIASTASAAGPGSIDRTFGTGGTATLAIGDPRSSTLVGAHAVVAAADGRLIVAGSADDPAGDGAIALAAFTADGAPDPGFGDGGTLLLQLGDGEPNGFVFSGADALAPLPDGGVIVVGNATTANGARAAVVMRLDRAGRAQWTTLRQFDGRSSIARAVAVQPDGRIVIAGATRNGAMPSDLLVARLHPESGALDPSFGGSGYVREPVPLGDPGGACLWGLYDSHGVAVTRSGSIVVGGTQTRRCGIGGTLPFAVLRAYDADGSRRPAFAPDPLPLGEIVELAAAADGGVVALGSTDGYMGPAVARYTAAGALDTAGFAAPAGFLVPAKPRWDLTDDAVLAVQRDRRLVVAGPPGPVLRLRADGRRDPSFGRGGAVSLGPRALAGVALQPDGGIVLLRGPRAEGNGFALTRLLGGRAASRVRIARVRAAGRRAALVRLSCARAGAAATCSGKVRIGARGARYRMAAGRTATVRVPLGGRLRRALRRGRAVTVRVRASNEHAATATRRVALR